MSNGHADLQALAHSRSDGLDPPPLVEDEDGRQVPHSQKREWGVNCPDDWFKEDSACDPNVKTVEGPKSDRNKYFAFADESKDPRLLHEMYLKLIPAYNTLWSTAWDSRMGHKSVKEKWALGWDSRREKWNSEAQWSAFYHNFRSNLPELLDRAPEEAEAAMALAGITSGAASWRSMFVGKVRFHAEPQNGGSWALARPPCELSRNSDGDLTEHIHPDFGRVLSIYKHKGPDGVYRMITRMKWFERSTHMYHNTLRCPLVSVNAASDEVDVMWPASGIVPWYCMAMPLEKTKTQNKQVMLARSWSVLRHLGFPAQPHYYPYPDLPPVVEDDVQDKCNEDLADAEDADYETESDPGSDDEEMSMDEEDYNPCDW